MAEWIVELGDGNIHIKKMMPLVRCKDCKWRSPYVKGHCDNPDIGLGTDDDDFCSMGERIDEDLRHALRADQTWAEYTLQNERMDEVEE